MDLVLSIILFMYVCVYVAKNCLFEVLLPGNLPFSVTYCLLIRFNCQKRCLLGQAMCSRKEIQKHFINGSGESQVFRNIVVLQ